MKRIFHVLFISGLFFMTTSAHAQFRRIPGNVTDSFKLRYPSAHDVTWEDKITAFQASFVPWTLQTVMTARYSSKGEWQGSREEDQRKTSCLQRLKTDSVQE